jgi:hypothetical protein
MLVGYDTRRSLLGLAAAALAALGAAAAARFQAMAGWQLMSQLLTLEAALALVVAAVPWRRSFGQRLAPLVFWAAAVLLVVAVPLIWLGTPVAACGCESYYGPLILGVRHELWAEAGLLGVPIMLMAISLPARRATDDAAPPGPGASNVTS